MDYFLNLEIKNDCLCLMGYDSVGPYLIDSIPLVELSEATLVALDKKARKEWEKNIDTPGDGHKK